MRRKDANVDVYFASIVLLMMWLRWMGQPTT